MQAPNYFSDTNFKRFELHMHIHIRLLNKMDMKITDAETNKVPVLLFFNSTSGFAVSLPPGDNIELRFTNIVAKSNVVKLRFLYVYSQLANK